MPDDDETVAAAEEALKATGLYFSDGGNGPRVVELLREKYPNSAILYVALPTSGGFALEAEDRLKPSRANSGDRISGPP